MSSSCPLPGWSSQSLSNSFKLITKRPYVKALQRLESGGVSYTTNTLKEVRGPGTQERHNLLGAHLKSINCLNLVSRNHYACRCFRHINTPMIKIHTVRRLEKLANKTLVTKTERPI